MTAAGRGEPGETLTDSAMRSVMWNAGRDPDNQYERVERLTIRSVVTMPGSLLTEAYTEDGHYIRQVYGPIVIQTIVDVSILADAWALKLKEKHGVSLSDDQRHDVVAALQMRRSALAARGGAVERGE